MAGLSWDLITLLADGKSHSGQALGKALGVSRAAVWKMVQALQAEGLAVESVRGQGYYVEGGVDLLCERQILEGMSKEAQSRIAQFKIFKQIDSTNTAASGADYGHGAVLLAEQQTAGRGRRGRPWVSPLVSNLYLTIRWGFTQGIASLEGLSLAVGVVIAETLESLGVPGVELKWPNDIWVKDQKLGGILVEIGGDVNGDCHAIVGVGLNVAMQGEASQSIDQAWTDLASLGYTQGRNRLAAHIINSLLQLLDNYQAAGFASYHHRWLQRNALANRQVSVSGAQRVSGIVTGLSDTGGLCLKTAEGERVINGGEVSVRPLIPEKAIASVGLQ